MKEIADILTDFLTTLRNETLDYYEKSYSYLKDLIAYKKINLDKKTQNESKKRLKSTIEKMLKAIKTGLNTIGVSINKLNENQKFFINSLSKDTMEYPDYNSYFEIYLKNNVNKILFEILFEYLLDIDTKKLENVNLFELIPPNFISKLNDFKKKYFSVPSNKEMFEQLNYDNYINFTDLTIKSKKISEMNILTQLREAKQDIIETLKTPKKELLKSSIENLDREIISKDITSQTKILPQKDEEFSIETDSDTFLDYFGQFSPIHTSIKDQFKIDKVNLINTKVVNQNFFDLENLYYFVSILKMLKIEFPFTNIEIFEILKNFIVGKIFSSSKDNIPDSKSIFFGLAILLELDLLYKTDLIDLLVIENFLKSNLEYFIPEKLELNFYSLLSLKLIAKKQRVTLDKNSILKIIYSLNLLKLDKFNPPLDIYNHLASIKLLKKEANLIEFKTTYIKEIKRLITPNNTVGDLITESAQVLLILDLLNLKEQERELCNNLLNFIINSTSFFSMENLDNDFNWRKDILGYKIELKMLYWALLASSKYTPINF